MNPTTSSTTSEINIYKRFSKENMQMDNQFHKHTNTENARDKSLPKTKEEIEIYQKLAEDIQIMKNRLNYIENSKNKSKKVLDSMIKKTNTFLATQNMAKELNRKVLETKAREESQKHTLKNRVAEITNKNKEVLSKKMEQIRSEKLKLSAQTRLEKMEIEKSLKIMSQEALNQKKNQVMKIKQDKTGLNCAKEGGKRDCSREALMVRGTSTNNTISKSVSMNQVSENKINQLGKSINKDRENRNVFKS